MSFNGTFLGNGSDDSDFWNGSAWNRSRAETEPDLEGAESAGDNWWGLLAVMLVVATAAGNILVCLAISWERRLQNVTNYFLMSLAITDLMVAVLVMPLGILNLVRGFFPLAPVYCLIWICLDVLFCTASIMHLCTISVDRYLSLRYPIKFGRNKTRRRVTLKIVFVWLLSIAMSLPLSLMYSQDYDSVLVDGTCQIPDPLYKLIGSIICFYIPLIVMLITYALTVRLLAVQQQNLGGRPASWSSGWMGVPGVDRRYTWRRLLHQSKTPLSSVESTPQHLHPPATGHSHHSSAGSTDTDMTTLDTHELWLPDSEPAPSTLSALHQFGAEMLRLSRGLESVGASLSEQGSPHTPIKSRSSHDLRDDERSLADRLSNNVPAGNHVSNAGVGVRRKAGFRKRRATTIFEGETKPSGRRKRVRSLHENHLDRRDAHEPQSDQSDSGLDDYAETDLFGVGEENHLPKKEPKKTPNKRTKRFFSVDIRLGDLEDDTVSATDSEQEKPRKRHSISFPRRSIQGEHKDRLKLGKAFLKRRASHDATETIPKGIPSRERERKLSIRTIQNAQSDTNNDASSEPEASDTETSKDPPESGLQLPPPCRCPYIGEKRAATESPALHSQTVVRWSWRGQQGEAKTGLVGGGGGGGHHKPILRRAATMRNASTKEKSLLLTKMSHNSSAQLFRSGSTLGSGAAVRNHHSRNSSLMTRNSSRHGRIIRLEQKATKVLGVVFFTFVILWAPFFVLNLVPSVCSECERNINKGVFDLVTWLGYASSMVNPIFYTIFNKVFRQTFKKVLLCKYHKTETWRPAIKK